MQYVRNLDGVRGLAIALVILFHYNFALEFGWVGVQLFFVLSGFLITTILLKSKDYSASTYFGGFYWRRSLRIFPIYYLYLLVIGALYILIKNPLDYAGKAPWLFSYTYNLYPLFRGFSFDIFFTHLWSLCIEEQFYILWPLIIFFLSLKQLRWVLILFLLGAPIVRFYMAGYLAGINTPEEFVGQIIYRFTFSQWDGFAYGALIPVFELQEKIKRPSRSFSLSMLGLMLIGIINFFSMSSQGVPIKISSFGYTIGVIQNYQHVWSYSLFGIVAMFFILTCLKPGPGLSSIVGNSFLVFLGRISYGLYVYHWVIWMIFNKFIEHSSITVKLLCFFPFVIVCIGMAYLSYILIEKPILSQKDWFKSLKSNGN